MVRPFAHVSMITLRLASRNWVTKHAWETKCDAAAERNLFRCVGLPSLPMTGSARAEPRRGKNRTAPPCRGALPARLTASPKFLVNPWHLFLSAAPRSA